MSKPLVSDDLWALVALLLPSKPLKLTGGRPGISDRAALIGINVMLAHGFLWEFSAQEWAVAAA